MNIKDKLKLILAVKEETAKDFGVTIKDPTLWDTAMRETHRKKSQIALYEEVLIRVVSEIDKTVHRSVIPKKSWLSKMTKKLYVPKHNDPPEIIDIDMKKLLSGDAIEALSSHNGRVTSRMKPNVFGNTIILNGETYIKKK